ncbi:hypothetical protein Clacol_003893 [Clathrus columnatus]|uniref:Transcription factor IIIC 90kDa subunit N-terminal domain-containing protein n=1 Tax=Clathrus columnatus TaxID=1419009 RepID=A0AAV5AAB5_9AGAM|nr:hypothetical protein Clacol_003893 [Clathrus columnatus]
MSNSQKLSHLSFPVAVPKPSPRNMQWSEDGQLFILSRNAIHILVGSVYFISTYSQLFKLQKTPELHMDPTLFSFLNPQLSSAGETPEEVKWQTNLIEIDKKPHQDWASSSDDWGALSLGSLDVSWVAMAPSPTNSSKSSCCVVVALTSNLEVSLWSPSKNHISGEWQKHSEIAREASYACSILGIMNSIESRVKLKDWNFRETGLSYIKAIQIAEDWILDITWSQWFRRDDGHHSAYIVCSAGDGSIYHVQIKISLDSREFKVESIGITNLHPADSTPTTALLLIENEDYGDDFEKVGLDDRIYVSGVIDYDRMGTLGWFYECVSTLTFTRCSGG